MGKGPMAVGQDSDINERIDDSSERRHAIVLGLWTQSTAHISYNTQAFFNPFRFTANLLGNPKSGKLLCSKEVVEASVAEVHSDPNREVSLGDCPFQVPLQEPRTPFRLHSGAEGQWSSFGLCGGRNKSPGFGHLLRAASSPRIGPIWCNLPARCRREDFLDHHC